MDPHALAGGFSAAPQWSLILGQLGSWLVIGGALLFLISLVSMAIGREKLGHVCFIAGCGCIAGAMAALASLFVRDQFHFEYVANHSWRDLPASYKIAAVWSGQQGSFLLWAFASAVFGLLVLPYTGHYRRWFVFTYALFLATICGILAYETPFGLLKDWVQDGVQLMPPDGAGLTPSLQNYWVIVHPPTIFFGFGSLTVPFAFAVSAILTRDLSGWLPLVRPWAMVALSILGLGLVMGGLWAYETQGWGGFWAWDPVENVSFVPWLFLAAFIHGLIVQATRGRWHWTNLLLGGLPFLLFVYGTFLTRSGFLSKFSVHSFAEMNRFALWILMGLLGVMTIGFVTLWATKGRKLAKVDDIPRNDEGFNREKGYQAGVILLTGLAATIGIGMSVPFFVGLSGGAGKVVEEPLYHSVVSWFFIPIMLLIGAVPFLSWRSMRASAFWGRLLNVIGLTVGIVGLMMLVFKRPELSDWSLHSHELEPIALPFGLTVPRFAWVIFLFGLATFATVGNLWRLGELFRRSKIGVGGFLSHIGVATALAGLILSRGLEMRGRLFVADGLPDSAIGYTVAYKGLSTDDVSDRDNKAIFEVTSASGASKVFTARPGLFYTPGQNGQESAFTWPHVQRELSHDVYLALFEPMITFWPEPKRLKQGETINDNGISVTFLGVSRTGEPGKKGTSFGAKLRIVEQGKEYMTEPRIVIGEQRLPVRATPTFDAAFFSMDVATNTAEINLYYNKPVFPIEIFYKPMTMLVWIGTGILFLGGMLSAFYRRPRRVPVAESASEPGAVETEENALVSTA